MTNRDAAKLSECDKALWASWPAASKSSRVSSTTAKVSCARPLSGSATAQAAWMVGASAMVLEQLFSRDSLAEWLRERTPAA